MKLIGKIHDYYDNCQCYGIDPSIVFDRTPRAGNQAINDWILDQTKEHRQHKPFYQNNNLDFLSLQVIGFCGKLYPVVVFNTEFVTSNLIDVAHRECYYDHDQLQKLITLLETKPYQPLLSFIITSIRYNEKTITKVIDNLEHRMKQIRNLDANHLFINHRVPFFHAELKNNQRCYEPVTLLPVLKSFDFYKAVNPFTAFQEISMYLGGIIPKQTPDLVSISDKDRIFQHGFNKYSFRHPVKL